MLRSDEFLTIIDFVFRNFPRDKEKLRRAASFITRQRVGRGAECSTTPAPRQVTHPPPLYIFFQGLQVTIASDINFEPHINYMIIIMLSSIGV